MGQRQGTKVPGGGDLALYARTQPWAGGRYGPVPERVATGYRAPVLVERSQRLRSEPASLRRNRLRLDGVFVSKLRTKLEADANVRIVNIRGVGYRLVVDE